MGTSGGPLRSSLDQSYRTGRVIRTFRDGPVVFQGEDEATKVEIDETSISSKSSFANFLEPTNPGESGGGGGGGGGGSEPDVVSADNTTLTTVDGSSDLGAVLIYGSLGGGPNGHFTVIFANDGGSITDAQTAADSLMGPGMFVGNALAPVLFTKPASPGDDFTYSAPGGGMSLGAGVTDPPTLTYSGGSYVTSLVWFTFEGNDYDATDSGTPSSTVLYWPSSGGGGGGGGGGGPTVVADASDPTVISGVTGASGDDYSLGLVALDAGGPILHIAFIIPASMTAAELASNVGVDVSAIVFLSSDGTFTGSPGPVLVATSSGSDYTWDSAPLDSSSVGAIVTSPAPPTLSWNGSAYEASYAEWTLGGDTYEYTIGEGGPLVDSYFFASGGSGSGPGDYAPPAGDFFVGSAEFVIGVGDRDTLTDEDSTLTAIYFTPTNGDSPDIQGSIDIIAQRVALGFRPDDNAQYPDVLLWRRYHLSNQPRNVFAARMGLAQGSHDAPGYDIYFGDAYELIGASKNDINGPFILLHRPTSGEAPAYDPWGMDDGGSGTDVRVVNVGSLQPDADSPVSVVIVGIQAQGGSSTVGGFTQSTYGASIVFDGGTPHYQSRFTSGGETTVELTVASDGVHPPSTVKPYTIVFGSPLMADPALILTCTNGGSGAREDAWFVNNLPGARTQAALLSGIDFGGIGGGSTLPTRALIGAALPNIGEATICGCLTFVGSPSANRIIGASPTGVSSGAVLQFFDADGNVLADPTPVAQIDTTHYDPRPAGMYLSSFMDVGTRTLWDDDMSPEHRSRVAVRAMPDIASNGVRPYGADAQPGFVLLESQDGTAYYLYVTNAGKLMISTTLPSKTATPGTVVGTQS